MIFRRFSSLLTLSVVLAACAPNYGPYPMPAGYTHHGQVYKAPTGPEPRLIKQQPIYMKGKMADPVTGLITDPDTGEKKIISPVYPDTYIDDKTYRRAPAPESMSTRVKTPVMATPKTTTVTAAEMGMQDSAAVTVESTTVTTTPPVSDDSVDMSGTYEMMNTAPRVSHATPQSTYHAAPPSTPRAAGSVSEANAPLQLAPYN